MKKQGVSDKVFEALFRLRNEAEKQYEVDGDLDKLQEINIVWREVFDNRNQMDQLLYQNELLKKEIARLKNPDDEPAQKFYQNL